MVRLNEQMYDEKVFVKQGIKMYDVEFLDGSCPEDVLLPYNNTRILSLALDQSVTRKFGMALGLSLFTAEPVLAELARLLAFI